MKNLLMTCGLLLTLLLLASSCAILPAGISDSNTPIGDRSYTVVGRAVETESRIYLLGFIPVTGANHTREAVEDAIDSKRGDALINITVEYYAQWWILFTRYTTRVEGDVIRFEREPKS